MSMKDARQFWTKVRQDESLQARLRSLQAKDYESAISAIQRVAKEAELTLTREEIAASLKQDGELGEEDLDRAVGGASLGYLSPSLQTSLGGTTSSAGFQSVSGLDSETTVVEYSDGEPLPYRRK